MTLSLVRNNRAGDDAQAAQVRASAEGIVREVAIIFVARLGDSVGHLACCAELGVATAG
jgi:hypothetical protein